MEQIVKEIEKLKLQYESVPVNTNAKAVSREEDIRQVREHLARLFGVKDKESLERQCYRLYSGSNEYEQFMTFWNEAPMFDLKELHPDGKKGFMHCKNIAEKFYPLVKEKGFYAWDICWERMGHGTETNGMFQKRENGQLFWMEIRAALLRRERLKRNGSIICIMMSRVPVILTAAGAFSLEMNLRNM